MVVDLLHDQPPGDGFPCQRAPAGALQRGGHGGQLRRQLIQRAEVRGDALAEATAWWSSGLGGEALPEERVQDVPAEVEGQVLLELPDVREVGRRAGFGDLF